MVPIPFDAGAIESRLTVDRKPFQQGLAQARAEAQKFERQKFAAKLDADGRGITRAVAAARAEGQKWAGQTFTATLAVDTGKGAADAAALAAAIRDVPSRKSINLRATVTGAKESLIVLQELSAFADRLDGRTVRMRAGLDGVPMALSEAGALDVALDRLDGRTVNVRADYDGAQVLGGLAATDAAASAVDGRNVNVRGNSSGLDAIILKLGTIITLASAASVAGVGALGALGAGAVAVGPGLGAAALGFSGVTDAVKAMSAEQGKSAASGAAAANAAKQQANQQANAAAQLQGAERSLANARASAAEGAQRAARAVQKAREAAADGVQRAIERERQAEKALDTAVKQRARTAEQTAAQVATAIRAEKRARDELNESYRTARERIIDLQFEVIGGALAERRAVLQVQKANEDLAAARRDNVGGRQMEEFVLAAEEATLALDRQRVANRRTGEEKADSDRRGVAGSKEVTAATERATDATRARQQAERDASDRIADADARVAEARDQARRAGAEVDKARRDGVERVREALIAEQAQQRQGRAAVESAQAAVEAAHRAMRQAMERTGTTGAAAADKAREALEKLSPAGQRFARFLLGLEGTWNRFRNTAQQGLLPGLEIGISRLLTREPEINQFIEHYASAMGDLAADTGAELATARWTNYFDWLGQRAGPEVRRFGQITGGALGGTAELLRAIAPLWDDMADAMNRGVATYDRWAQAAARGESPGFNRFMDTVRTYGPVVWDTIVDITQGVWHLAESLAPMGALALELVGGFAEIISNTPAPVLIAVTTAAIGLAAAWKGLKIIGAMGSTFTAAQRGADLLGLSMLGTGTQAQTGAGKTRGFGAAVGKLAVGLPIAGLALMGLQAGFDAVFTSSSEAAAALMKGGETAEAMSQQLAAHDAYLDDFEKKYGSAARAVEEWLQVNVAGASTSKSAAEELEKQRAAMSDLERAQSIATEKQNNLIAAQDRYGPASQEAAAASDELKAATRDVGIEQVKLRDNVDDATAAIIYQRDTQLESLDANLRKRQADLDAADAQKALNDAIAESGPKSEEAAQAQIQLEQSQLRAAEAAVASEGGQAAYNETVAKFVRENKGPMSETLLGLVQGMDAAGLASIGARVEVDNTGAAVLRLPDGKTISLSTENGPALEGIDGLSFALQTVPEGKTIHLNALTEPEKLKLQDLGFTVVTLPDGTVNVTANDAQARADLLAFQLFADWQEAHPDLAADPAKAHEAMRGFIDTANRQTGVPDLDADPAKADATVRRKLDEFNRWGAAPDLNVDTAPADQQAKSWWGRIGDWFRANPLNWDTLVNWVTGRSGGGPVGGRAFGGLVGSYAAGGYLPRLASGGGPGGLLVGPGSGTSDSIMAVDPVSGAPTARVSNGEYVIRRRAVETLGVPTLDRLNALHTGGPVLARYAAGGGISAAATATSGPRKAVPAVAAPAGDPAAVSATADATDGLTTSMLAAAGAAGTLDPALQALAATQAGTVVPAQDAVTAGQQNLVAAGIVPLQGALTGVLAPALTGYQQQVGVAAPAANNALQAAQGLTRQSTTATAQNTAANTSAMTAATTGMSLASQGQHSALRQSQGQTVLANTALATNTQIQTGRMSGDTGIMRSTVEGHLGGVRGAQGVTSGATTAFADNWRSQLGRTMPDSANPLRWVINFPIRSLTEAWNTLDREFALGKHVRPFVPNFAAGGVMPGYTPGRDVGYAHVSGGEAIMRPEWTSVMTPAYVDAANRAARDGGQAGVRNFLGGRADQRAAGAATQRLMATRRLDDHPRYARSVPGWAGRFAYGGVAPHVAAAGNEVERTIGRPPGGIGGRGSRGNASDHPSGHALDFMTLSNVGMGNRIASHMQQHAERLAVKYIIWQQKINSGRGWRQMENRGSATANHMDHPHVSFEGGPLGGTWGDGPAGGAGFFDPTPIVEAAFAKARREVADVSRFFGPSTQVGRDQGVAGFAAGKVQAHALAKVQEMFAVASGGPGAEQWRGVALEALRRTGQPANLVERVLQQIQIESGGNPRAINLWDVNARRGTPSKGLIQTIDPTFQAHRDRSLANDPYDPLANLVAGIRYAIARYGGIERIWPKKMGYDNGGPFPDGTVGVNTSGRTEQVLTGEQRDALTRRLNRDETSTAARGGTGGPDLLAALADMTERIETAVARARAINVHPRERQSEESIAAMLQRREDREARVATL